MRRFPGPDPRTVAVVAAVAAVGLLVTLAVWRHNGILPVILALLCVLLAMISGTAVAAMRQRDEQDQTAGDTTPAQPESVLHGIDADTDTLEALDSHAVRERHRRVNGVSDR